MNRHFAGVFFIALKLIQLSFILTIEVSKGFFFNIYFSLFPNPTLNRTYYLFTIFFPIIWLPILSIIPLNTSQVYFHSMFLRQKTQ